MHNWIQYYNDVVSVLSTECFTDFSSTERFQHYLIAERSWRFEIESVLNSLASKVDEIKSNSANSDSGHSYDFHSKVNYNLFHMIPILKMFFGVKEL